MILKFNRMPKPLNTIQILRELNNDYCAKNLFHAVLPRDKLKLKLRYPAGLIINSKPSFHSGEHWFAIFYNADKEATFFDSYGNHPSYYKMVKYLNKTSSTWCYNKKQLQGFLSSTCGYYCVYFILLMSRGFNLDDIITEFNKKDFNFNDFKVSLLIN